MANNQCKECGCICSKCTTDHDVHLHAEIENLKQRLVERDNHIVKMETNFLNEANKFPNGEVMALREELLTWQDKYKRLYEAHRRVQRVNQGLEDKLLRLVDVCETDKNTLTKDVATLSHKLADANYTIKKLTEDNERYKNDVLLAIQFLQCKPGNFVSQKFDSLPNEVQTKVSSYMANKRKPEINKPPPEIKSIKVPIPTFPPTAMVYSVPKSPNSTKSEEKDPETPVDIVSAAIMAKVLEERERERSCIKHCDTCTCSKHVKIIHHTTHHTVSTQTREQNTSLCSNCNVNFDIRPSLVKNVDNNKNKGIPVYIHDYETNANQNIAKVQPYNFQIDSNHTKTLQSKKCDKNAKLAIEKINNTNPDDLIDLFSNNGAPVDDVVYYNLNERKERAKVEKLPQRGVHHHTNWEEGKRVDEQNGAKLYDSSDLYKGGRYCSMRMQTSNNILLDNTSHPSILYTTCTNGNLTHNINDSQSTKPNSISSDEGQTVSSISERTSNKRVEEWIQNNIEVDSSSDYSDCDKNDEKLDEKDMNNIDKERYKEMEDNVKRFLFGEYNFVESVTHNKDVNNITE